MRKFIPGLLIFLQFGTIQSQVGINTTTPSTASVLEVSSSSDGVNFGGFMPPRVTPTERDLIPVTTSDEGLMVYVVNPPNSQMQIWDGSAWQTLFPQNMEFSAIITAWEVEGLSGSGPTVFDASTVNNSVIVGGLTKSPIINPGTANNAWGGVNWHFSGPNLPQDAIDAESYVTFTITPRFGVKVSLTEIETYNIRRSGTGPTTGIWQYSIDGTNFMNINSTLSWGTITDGTGNPQPAIDLSGISDLQNLTSTTTVTFRIVNWGATAAGGSWYINNVNGNDLIIRGNLSQ